VVEAFCETKTSTFTHSTSAPERSDGRLEVDEPQRPFYTRDLLGKVTFPQGREALAVSDLLSVPSSKIDRDHPDDPLCAQWPYVLGLSGVTTAVLFLVLMLVF